MSSGSIVTNRVGDPELAYFLGGLEKNVWLHFNCEDNILNKI